MNVKKNLLLLVFSVFTASSVLAAELAGVNLPEKMQIASQTMYLNGAGVRKKMVFDVYVGALYATTTSTDAQALMSAATPRRMQMHMLRDVDAATLYQALLEGLQDNQSPAAFKSFASRIAELEKIFSAAKVAGKGDLIVLDFIPGQGTRLQIRGKQVGLIAGDEFAAALLAIWLGAKPVHEDLKKSLLGTAR